MTLPAFASAFESAGFRRLWLGAFVSGVGTWTQDVALAWLIHQRFGDPRYLGYRSFVAEVPLLAFMLLGGARADRGDRRAILVGSQLVQMASAVLLLVLYVTGYLSIGAILLLAFVTGVAQSQSAPTYQATLTTLVPRPHIPSAVALNSLQFNLSRALGPAIAAAILAVGGAAVCFGVNAASYVAVIAAIARLDLRRTTPAPSESILRSLASAWKEVVASPVLRPLMILGGLGSFLVFPLITFLPVVAARLGAGASGYSLLMSALGAGAIAGALFTAHQGARNGRGLRTLFAFVACGAAMSLAVWSPDARLTAVLLALAGFAMVAALSTVNALVQEHAPESFRGRVVSIFGLAFRGGGPVGGLSAGFLVARFGPAVALAGFGTALIVLSALVFWKAAALRRL